jgi:hypothetical protein
MTAPFRMLSRPEFARLSAAERDAYIRAASVAVSANSNDVRALVELNRVLLENAKERREEE